MFTSGNEEIFFLSHIKTYHSVLEYGSGTSTKQIAQKCNKIISVEHQKEWYDHQINNQMAINCQLLYFPPNTHYVEGTDCGSMEQFFDYIHAPLPYAPFDIILIDGRARVACASISQKLIRNYDSLIFIHDWHRIEYHECLKTLELIDVCETMAKLKVKIND